MYDFDQTTNRRGTDCLKWDVGEKELPMWVADMDFKTVPEVTQALTKRAESGVFGYAIVPDRWYEAIAGWWDRRHNFTIKHEWITFCTGVIPAVSTAVKRMTNTGDNVVVQTPVYNIFFNSIENHGRHVLESALKYEEGAYHIDFEDLEEKLANPQTTMMILCNPHNPIGKIWSREELGRIGNLCKKHHVLVISDEIHCDLTMPGREYTPFAAVSKECANNSITCISSSKTFNLAGLQGAAVVIPDEGIRERMVRGLNSDEVAEPNAFVIDAMTAAFNEGDNWLEELRAYLAENKKLVEEYLCAELPELRLISSDATYLLWVDCREAAVDAEEFCRFIRRETGLYLSAGNSYRGNGAAFVRINIACQRATVQEGMARLKRGVEAYQKWLINCCQHDGI